MADRLGLVVASGTDLPVAGRPVSAEPDPTKGGDVYGWAMQQAELIRARRFDEIDWINVADEIEGVAKTEVGALTSNLVVLLTHMLKWDYQHERRGRSWSLSIEEHRARVEDELADNTSMRPKLPDILPRAYRSARSEASVETDLPVKRFPGACPYDWDAIMTRPFVLDHTDEAP